MAIEVFLSIYLKFSFFRFQTIELVKCSEFDDDSGRLEFLVILQFPSSSVRSFSSLDFLSKSIKLVRWFIFLDTREIYIANWKF